MHSPKASSGIASNNATEYREIFARRVHQLIQLGYQRLDPTTYVKAQEPAITGDLVEAVDGVLNDRAEDWMNFYSVYDDPPVNDGRRKGKKRKRVDLRIDSALVRPRARFRFEAKRLGKRNTVAVYLGAEGLGCFLSGDYAREEEHAGMLGYVQSGELKAWGEKIAQTVNEVPSDYHLDPSSPFAEVVGSSTASSQSYQSVHNRPTVGCSILIDHILMRFQ